VALRYAAKLMTAERLAWCRKTVRRRRG